MKTDVADRLSALKIEMDPATLDRQLAATSAALKEPLLPAPRHLRRRMRLAPVLASLVIFAVPVTGVAVAAESAIPGEILFPVKQVTEQVRAWFDPGVRADHRLDELETVLDRGGPPDEVASLLSAADQAVADLTLDDERSQTFEARLDAARIRLRDRSSDPTAPPDGEPGLGDRTERTEPPFSDPDEPGQQRGGSESDQPPADGDRGEERTRTTSTSTTSTTVPPRDDSRSDGGDPSGEAGPGGDAPGDESTDQPPRRRGDG